MSRQSWDTWHRKPLVATCRLIKCVFGNDCNPAQLTQPAVLPLITRANQISEIIIALEGWLHEALRGNNGHIFTVSPDNPILTTPGEQPAGGRPHQYWPRLKQATRWGGLKTQGEQVHKWAGIFLLIGWWAERRWHVIPGFHFTFSLLWLRH